MGGAAFPTHVKFAVREGQYCDTIILNGAECETHLTADHRLMLAKADEIVHGLRIFMQVLGRKEGFIGIENNKPDAIAALEKAAAPYPGIQVVSLRVRYPQGAEKQLIKALTGREVPCGGLPMDVGCLVQNVATAQATYRAVAFGEPLIGRYCTVTGDAIHTPTNLEILIGTPIGAIIEAAGGLTENVAKVIAGGPMMGIGQADADVPAVKGTGGVLCLSHSLAIARPERACIRCGTCVDNCPMGLLPTSIAGFTKIENIDEAEKLGAMDCIECGCCSYGCPASIPLVQYIRLAKSEIMARRRRVS